MNYEMCVLKHYNFGDVIQYNSFKRKKKDTKKMTENSERYINIILADGLQYCSNRMFV